MLHLSVQDGAALCAALLPPRPSQLKNQNRRAAAQAGKALLGFSALLALVLESTSAGAVPEPVPEDGQLPEDSSAPTAELLALAIKPAEPLPPVEVLFAALEAGAADSQAAQAQLDAFFESQGIDAQLTGPLDLSLGSLARSIGVSDPAIGIRDIVVSFDDFAAQQSIVFTGVVEQNTKAGNSSNPPSPDPENEETDPDEDGSYFHITLVDGDFSQVFHFDQTTGEGYVHDEGDFDVLVAVPDKLMDRLLLAAGGVEGAVVDISDYDDGYFFGDGGFPDLETETTSFEPYAIN